MLRQYQPAERRLIFIDRQADADFWDHRWSKHNLANLVHSVHPRNQYLRLMGRFISPNDGPILEGGCGKGQFVYAFERAGYRCVGCDFAGETLTRVKHVAPELKLVKADVRALPFPDGIFCGYWSVGVIEHFWDGFDDIVREMNRVLKQNGYAFVAFPFMSILRKAKVRLGCYDYYSSSQAPKGFYQFALNPASVVAAFADRGFDCVSRRPTSGGFGLKDEVPAAEPVIAAIQRRSQKHWAWKVIEKSIAGLLAPVCGHMLLCVFRKRLSL